MLTDTHRYNSEDSFGSSVPQQDVNKGDDLKGFAETHAVSQNTTEPTAVLIALERLHQIVIQETNTADLKERSKDVEMKMKRKKKGTFNINNKQQTTT